MVFENVELFNIDHVADGEYGKRMVRVLEDVRLSLNPKARDVSAYFTTGVEIRFVMNCDSAILKLALPETDENKFFPIQLFYGGIQAGWTWLDPVNLHSGLNEIVINKPKMSDKLVEKTKEDGYAFDCNVIRVLLSSFNVEFVGIEGDVRPPRSDETPKKKILFYGSSITHGSLAMLPSNYFVSLVGDALNANVYNKGFPGSCHVEYAMSDYIASRSDCDFVVAEVGTNVYRAISDDEFEKRIMYLIKTYTDANPGKKLYIIDNLILDDRNEECRKIVKKCIDNANLCNVTYINGWNLLESRRSVAADFTHPTAIGHMRIANNLLKIIG